MTRSNKQLFSTRNLTTMAILAAVAALLFMLEIPVALFYKLDFSSLPVVLGTFAMGPLAGMIIQAVKSALGLLHSTSQGVGELADFLMGLAMLLPVGLLYQRKKTRKAAIWGLVAGSVSATLVAVVTNVYLMIPFYGAVYGMPVETIVGMGQALVPAIDSLWKFVLFITAPFNVLKWTLVSLVTVLVYKPLSPILHQRGGQGAR